MIPLVIIRPEPGCTASALAARALGLEAVAAPLFAVSPEPWQVPDPQEFDALLVGSANVFRHGGHALARFSAKPVHVVGAATAAAARAAGFSVGSVGSGGLQQVLDAVPAGIRLLRLAGAERIALTPPEGVSMAERTVYASRPQAMSNALATRLQESCAVALHSAGAARHFAAECDRLNIARNRLSLVTIGPRVSLAAGSGWRTVRTAEEPSETALLANARDLCKTPAGD